MINDDFYTEYTPIFPHYWWNKNYYQECLHVFMIHQRLEVVSLHFSRTFPLSLSKERYRSPSTAHYQDYGFDNSYHSLMISTSFIDYWPASFLPFLINILTFLLKLRIRLRRFSMVRLMFIAFCGLEAITIFSNFCQCNPQCPHSLINKYIN